MLRVLQTQQIHKRLLESHKLASRGHKQGFCQLGLWLGPAERLGCFEETAKNTRCFSTRNK